jgi:hypothetical protein
MNTIQVNFVYTPTGDVGAFEAPYLVEYVLATQDGYQHYYAGAFTNVNIAIACAKDLVTDPESDDIVAAKVFTSNRCVDRYTRTLHTRG